MQDLRSPPIRELLGPLPACCGCNDQPVTLLVAPGLHRPSGRVLVFLLHGPAQRCGAERPTCPRVTQHRDGFLHRVEIVDSEHDGGWGAANRDGDPIVLRADTGNEF